MTVFHITWMNRIFLQFFGVKMLLFFSILILLKRSEWGLIILHRICRKTAVYRCVLRHHNDISVAVVYAIVVFWSLFCDFMFLFFIFRLPRVVRREVVEMVLWERLAPCQQFPWQPVLIHKMRWRQHSQKIRKKKRVLVKNWRIHSERRWVS